MEQSNQENLAEGGEGGDFQIFRSFRLRGLKICNFTPEKGKINLSQYFLNGILFNPESFDPVRFISYKTDKTVKEAWTSIFLWEVGLHRSHSLISQIYINIISGYPSLAPRGEDSAGFPLPIVIVPLPAC